MLVGLAAGLPASSILSDAPESVIHLVALGASIVAFGLTALRQGRGHGASVLGLVGAAFWVVSMGLGLLAHPMATFVGAMLVAGFLAWRKRPVRRGGLDLADPATLEVWGAIGPAGAVSLLAVLDPELPPLAELGAFAAPLFLSLLGAQAIARLECGLDLKVRWWVLWVGLFAAGALTSDIGLRSLTWWASGSLVLLASAIHDTERRPFASIVDGVLGRPDIMLATSFALTIFVGGIFLSLPIAGEGGTPVAALDALFTAVSATCVTGLIVVDTPSAYGWFGEATILVLIQLGGLGIMTFSTAALALLRKRPSIRHERALSDVLMTWEGSEPNTAVRRIFAVTLISELLGALLLATRFSITYGDSVSMALWRGLFTAVSAFCNAGFALQTESLVPYQNDALVTLIVSTLIIVGGLGPVVVTSLLDMPRRRRAIPVELMLFTSAALVVSGTVLFAAFEWENVLSGMSLGDRLHNAFFQSVTLRTAGFNSIDFGALLPQTQALMLLYMFVGGCPGSTAGGIKTTTFAVILLSVVATITGRPETVYRSRRINHETFYRSVAIVVLGATSILFLWISLLLTQRIPALPALFETVSALGTVGLSVGVTGDLDEVGKVLVAFGMFAGRLGPMTLLFIFADRRGSPRWRYPETGLPVG